MRGDMYLLTLKCLLYSFACAINLGSSVIITGGDESSFVTSVTEYNEAGWVRDLPPLIQGRDNHGCNFYDNAEGTKVDITINYCPSNNFSDIPRVWWLDWQCLAILH